MTQPQDETVHELAALIGIESEYYDNWGNLHLTSLETKKALLYAMGMVNTAEALRQKKLEPWNTLIEPVMVASVTRQPLVIPIHFALQEGTESEVTLTMEIVDEDGKKETHILEGVNPVETTEIDGVRYVRVELANDTNRPLGYYGLTLEINTLEAQMSGSMCLIIAPDRCHMPQKKTWGVSINLYSLRSEDNWGCGDLTDLSRVLDWAAKDLGAGFVGINPLHAIPNRMPYGISPYSSSSRLYRNHIYIDLNRVLDKTYSGRQALKDPALIKMLRRLRAMKLIDYEAVASLKHKTLKTAFADFYATQIKKATPLADKFEAYVKSQGTALRSFSVFMALEEHLRKETPELYDWRQWPIEYQNPESSAVQKFRKSHIEDVLFYQYAQWLLDTQLQALSKRTDDMSIGLYNDLAVGSSGQGCDAWSFPEIFAFGVTAGAPPDAFNLNGQDWGFPPCIPKALRDTGYELFIKTMRHNMQHAGAMRIDHALGMFRLFWIPEGATPSEGTYVRYPAEDLLRIIALESVRNECTIIAEDLGTVGDTVREKLHEFGMLSYRLFYFERDWSNGTFLPPEAYPEEALTAVSTHDLPTLRGYWSGRDIEVKTELGLYPDDEAQTHDMNDRGAVKQAMLNALEPLLPEGFTKDAGSLPEMTAKLSAAVHRHIAKTPSLLVAVSLDDIISEVNQQNMPGTIDTHPNWRQKARTSLKELPLLNNALEFARIFREESRS